VASERPDQRIPTDQLRTLGASGLGCSIVVSLVVFIVGGLLLDEWIGTKPVFLLVGVGVGLVAAGYQLYELTLLGKGDGSAGPVTRAINAARHKQRDPTDQSK
jgi:hypothetical protein